MERHFTFVVIGGGIAGVSCVESLKFWSNDKSVLLITSSPIVKAAKSAVCLTRNLVKLDVGEVDVESILIANPGLEILTDLVVNLNHSEKSIITKKGFKIAFEKLCICAGAQPNLIEDYNPYVLGLRDTESVVEFEKRISSARRIIIVGNGGIASEIVHEVKGVEKIWVMKDEHFTKTFLDPGAAEFLYSSLVKSDEKSTAFTKRMKYELSRDSSREAVASPALGPDWHSKFDLKGKNALEDVILEYGATIERITSNVDREWPITVLLSNNKSYGADFLVSATGVTPNSKIFKNGNEELKLGEDGGIVVNDKMETSLKDVFAAGDICTAGWEEAQHWHQMRLWGQARQMGMYAAKCMAASLENIPVYQDFCFEIFTHVTKLFGFKVILLGLFNGQKLNGKYEILLRVTRGVEYVKLILQNGRMQGAILIGETDLEEMCENLILNQLDLSTFGESLLDPNIDIEDYFD